MSERESFDPSELYAQSPWAPAERRARRTGRGLDPVEPPASPAWRRGADAAIFYLTRDTRAACGARVRLAERVALDGPAALIAALRGEGSAGAAGDGPEARG